MPAPRPSRLLLLLCLATSLQAQVPASPPTSTPAVPQLPPAQASAQRAKITFISGQLSIQANNSSLNQILHEISQVTGITITGNVIEERVFGSYGPGAPAEVFDQLLDGTAINILFMASSGTRPSELILTPRSGIPIPPSRNQPEPAAQASPSSDTNDDASARPASPPQPDPPASAAPTTPTDPNQQQSPSNNNAKTPQQIYDQLMKMRQQQQSQ